MNTFAFFDTEAGNNKYAHVNYLSAGEEKELSKQILAGNEAKAALTCEKPMSESERDALKTVIEKGAAAYERLIMENLPRAYQFAYEAYRKNAFGLNEKADYFQTAMKVICSCAGTFDWQMGCRFGTYVHRCMKNELLRENARNGYAVRIPEENLQKLGVLKRLNAEMGIDRAAAALGISADLAASILAAGTVSKSLQEPVNWEDPDTELGDCIADAYAMTADEIESGIDREQNLEKLRAAFSMLDPDEKVLLKGRFGLGTDQLPMRAFIGTVAKSVSGVQKKQEAAEKHLRELFFSLPMAE